MNRSCRQKINTETLDLNYILDWMHSTGIPGGLVVKNPPAMHEMQKMQVWSLGQEEGMATHSNVLAWRIPWTEEPGRLQSVGWQRVGHDWKDWACILQTYTGGPNRYIETNLTDIYRIFHPIVVQYIFFSSIHRTVSRIRTC